MSYIDKDRSIEDGEPVELYKFVGELGAYYYTNDSQPRDYGGNTYVPSTISRSAIEVTSVLDSISTVDVLLPLSHPLAKLYCYMTMPQTLNVEIYRWHRGTSLTTDVKKIWDGRAVGFSVGAHEAAINTQSILQAGLNSSTNQVVCQALCNHKLYDGRCKVQRDDWKLTSRVTKIQDLKVYIQDDFTTGGEGLKYGTMIIDRTNESRLIFEDNGTEIVVTYAYIDIVVGDTVTIYTGCNKSYAMCKDKFDNILNFGGFKWLPTDNPYTGGI